MRSITMRFSFRIHPSRRLGTFWERALIPFVYCRLAARFSFARVNDPRQPDAAANGQFLLVLRDAYESVGGHAAVASEIVEDVALARRSQAVRAIGIYFTAPIGTVRTRMYGSFAAMWQGWTKNLYPLMGGRPRSALLELEAFPLSEILALAFVWALLFRAEHVSAWLLLAVVLGAFAGAHLRYAIALYRNLFPIFLVQYYVPGACLYAAVLIASWWKNTRGAVAWKGREYPAKDPGQRSMIRVTRKVEFSAAHFYHNPAFSAEENQARVRQVQQSRMDTGTTTCSKSPWRASPIRRRAWCST